MLCLLTGLPCLHVPSFCLPGSFKFIFSKFLQFFNGGMCSCESEFSLVAGIYILYHPDMTLRGWLGVKPEKLTCCSCHCRRAWRVRVWKKVADSSSKTTQNSPGAGSASPRRPAAAAGPRREPWLRRSDSRSQYSSSCSSLSVTRTRSSVSD